MRPSFLSHMHLTAKAREDIALAVLAGACIALIFLVRHV